MTKKKNRVVDKEMFMETMLNLKNHNKKEKMMSKKIWGEFHMENQTKKIFRW